MVHIKAAYKKSRNTYGSPRITAELKDQGISCSKNRVARLMRQEGIQAKMKQAFKVTTRSKKDHPVSANLLEQNFEVEEANRVWASDITYLSTGEGWLYMCAIEDLFSRRIVGWAIRPYLTVDLVRQAFYMACGGRQPEPGVIFHSDRGSQYTSQLFQQELARRGFVPSMSGKGNCFDNAVMESFFHTLKTEEVNLNTYASRKDAVEAVADYIILYNQVRRHSYLGYLSPMHFEMANVA